MTLDQKIEAVLFLKGEPVSVKKLAELLEVTGEEIEASLEILTDRIKEGGLNLVIKGNEIMLGTRPELGPLLEKIHKEEIAKDLSKASLETLSIILYKAGTTRSEIDWIRGVNSSFILRNLLIRGLIERTTHPSDSRKYLYQPTFELISFLGLSRIEDLPEFTETKAVLEKRETELKEDKDQ